jgi:hypothetical protein
MSLFNVLMRNIVFPEENIENAEFSRRKQGKYDQKITSIDLEQRLEE